MRTKTRYVFLITIAILLFLITCSEVWNNSIDDEVSERTALNTRQETSSEEENKPAAASKNSGPVPVLIVSYMRSGSTFTADVITSYPSSYYLFEPMKVTVEKLAKNSTIELINGTRISRYNANALAADFLQSWLTCKFDGQDKEAVVKLIGTRSTTPFKICLRKGKSNKNETVLQTCLKILQKQCESSKIRLVKEIRVGMRTTIAILLKKVPGLKVVHLLRDQRPRLLSAEKTPLMLHLTLQKTAKMECADASDNLAVQKELQQQYPGQLETLLYERLAENPILISKRIFDFLHLPFTAMSIEKIQSMTSSTHEVPCPFCTSKKDSAKTAHAWRTRKSSNFVKIKMIEEECEDIQTNLGYIPLKNMDELRNASFNLRINIPLTSDVL
ncbi:carbohydrate sulfotransferase 6-like [Mizuhopecten yessoensis]|uniref:Carbohydrate sulfotransferase 4 n=1 Tax=Mizuhopecten yessoensis TaxID=6573 RepID=A0A210PS79_MIZYE|nr:carbohydrate sulfotransferase 6-like [Mizuhopecten yessoensis]OWF39341.1 Carbohydrate sulfotransferase 4 [Mizuhopecten yessoensis]